MITQGIKYTYAPDGQALQCGVFQPVPYTPDGRRIVSIDPARLPDYGWYPERPREALPPYADGWEEHTVIDPVAREAVWMPIVPSETVRLARAMDALRARLQAERDRLVAIASTGLDPETDPAIMGGSGYEAVRARQLAALMQASQLIRHEARGEATPDQIDALDAMDAIPAEVHAIDVARAAIEAWAAQTVTTWAEADAIDPRTLPPEAPQWP